MDESELTLVVIPKEDAVFWMDRFGKWHNEGGPFKHKRIIDYFNTSIRRDGDGYFVEQIRDDVREKVYFRYEDTPLFVLDAIIGDPLKLILNTGEKIALSPEFLFVSKDHLYLQRGDEKIKFSDRVLLKLAAYLDYDEVHYYFIIGDGRYLLREN